MLGLQILVPRNLQYAPTQTRLNRCPSGWGVFAHIEPLVTPQTAVATVYSVAIGVGAERRVVVVARNNKTLASSHKGNTAASGYQCGSWFEFDCGLDNFNPEQSLGSFKCLVLEVRCSQQRCW
jgi:hypothetical protein